MISTPALYYFPNVIFLKEKSLAGYKVRKTPHTSLDDKVVRKPRSAKSALMPD